MNQVRSAGVPDIPAIQLLARITWPPTYTPIIGIEQVEYMLDLFYSVPALLGQMQKQGHQFVLLEADGQPLGFASYSETAPGRFRLHKLYVLPALQGQGAGRLLLQEVEKRIAGAQSLELNVNRFNPALGFYTKQGFRILRSEDIRIGSGYFMNDYVMEKSFE